MDEEAFEALWNAHYADILAFCLRRLGNRHSTFVAPTVVSGLGSRP